jgi:uncharacterized membrane protein YfcA
VLIAAFVPIMLGSAAMLWRTAGARGEDCAAPRCPPLQLPVALVAGGGIGTVTGFLGVGGGFLIVPTLVVALALSMRLAVGTSLAIIAGTSLFGLATHLGAGRELDVGATLAISVGCVAGALLGCRLCGRIPQARLARGFALLVCGVAAYLFASAAFLGVPS